MNDPEIKDFIKKGLIILTIIIVFAIPIYFIYNNKIKGREDPVLSSIEKKESFILYIVGNKCSNCKELEKALQNVEYKKIDDKYYYYNRIIKNIGADNTTITTPSLMYIEKGQLYSYIVDIQTKEEIKEFIKSYK